MHSSSHIFRGGLGLNPQTWTWWRSGLGSGLAEEETASRPLKSSIRVPRLAASLDHPASCRWRLWCRGRGEANWDNQRKTIQKKKLRFLQMLMLSVSQFFLICKVRNFLFCFVDILLKSAELLSLWKFETISVFADLCISEFKLNISQRKEIFWALLIFDASFKKLFSLSTPFFAARYSKISIEKGP